MQVENLNEMIQQVPKRPVDFNAPDYIYSLPREKLTYDDIVNERSDTENQAADSNLPQVEIVEQTDTTEAPTNNYEPESEEALIEYATNIHNKVQTFSIGGYWEIGRTINSFYQGKYGTRELERIAEATGIGRDTLNKMCKFAKQYSRDQVEALLSGAFSVTWFQIAQNLSVEPDKLIQVYQETGDPKQFHNDIMKFKDSRESRGKSKGGLSVAMPANAKESSTSQVAEVAIINETLPEKGVEVDIIQAPDGHAKEISDLRAKIAELRKDLDHRQYQVDQLQELYHETALEFKKKDELIEKLRATLKQVQDMVENGCEHWNILSEVDWRV